MEVEVLIRKRFNARMIGNVSYAKLLPQKIVICVKFKKCEHVNNIKRNFKYNINSFWDYSLIEYWLMYKSHDFNVKLSFKYRCLISMSTTLLLFKFYCF